MSATGSIASPETDHVNTGRVNNRTEALRERAEAAEARCASLEAEREKEHDHNKCIAEMEAAFTESLDQALARAEAAEAKLAALDLTLLTALVAEMETVAKWNSRHGDEDCAATVRRLASQLAAVLAEIKK